MINKDIHDELNNLKIVLEEADRQDILTEVVWDAFNIQHKKGYDLIKSFNQSLWDWTLIEAKREKKGCPIKFLENMMY